MGQTSLPRRRGSPGDSVHLTLQVGPCPAPRGESRFLVVNLFPSLHVDILLAVTLWRTSVSRLGPATSSSLPLSVPTRASRDWGSRTY